MPLDIFDKLDLSVEDKIIMSGEFRKHLIGAIVEGLKSMKIDQIVKRVIEEKMGEITNAINTKVKELDTKTSGEIKAITNSMKSSLNGEVNNLKNLINFNNTNIKKERDTSDLNVRRKIDETSNGLKKIISQEMENRINDFASKFKGETNSSQEEFKDTVRKKFDDVMNMIINQPRYELGGFSPQFNDLVIGPDATEGSWRIVRSGDDLVVEKYESGSWNEKGAFEA